MLNLGPGELALIIALAIMVIGPRQAIRILRSLGRIVAQLRRLSQEFVSTIQTELDFAEESAEAEGEEGRDLPQEPVPDSARSAGGRSDLRWEAEQIAGDIARGINDVIEGVRGMGDDG